MTECEKDEFRDMLPDLVGETLAADEHARLLAHLRSCEACQAEVALIRVARAARPRAVHVNVDAIVARIVAERKHSLASANAHVPTTHLHGGDARATASALMQRQWRRRRSTWQLAAAIGVVAIGSWSMYVARVGSFGLVSTDRSDTALLAERAEQVASPSRVVDSGASGAQSTTTPVTVASAERATGRAIVSVGNLGDYTDAELQGMLDRLEKWDGATSSDVVPTMPLVPVSAGGVRK